MSPEQALGREVDAKADIFSLGVVLYEMATGANPFLGPTPQATLARILHHQPELVSLVNPAIPPELERLIHLCLRKEPKQRPSAQEVTNTCKRLSASVSSWAATAPALGSPSEMPVLVSNSPPASNPAASGAVKPPSGSQRVSSPLPPAPASPAMVKRLTWTYYGIKTCRILLAVATITVPLSFFVYMLVGAKIVRTEIVEGTAVWSYVQAVVIPVLAAAEKIFTFRPVVNGWNLMLAGLGVVVLVVRHFIMLPVDRMEFLAKAKLVRARSNPAQVTAMPVTDRRVNNRLTLLREYSEGQQRRSGQGQRLAILSIDVVGWPRMTLDEDALVVEHAYAEYKKFIDRLLRSHGAQKTLFSANGTLCAFERTDDAVAAAKAVLNELPWFNEDVHKLKSAFHVRCGVNSGSLTIPEGKALDELRSEVIDIAVDMQKSAPPDTVWLSGEVLAEASDGSGFATVTSQKVEGRTAYEWRALVSSPSVGKPSSARSAD
jgi:class 3 adenylate cyclase